MENKDVVLCKNCIYCKCKYLKNFVDGKMTSYIGYICKHLNHFNQVVMQEDYCSKGEERKDGIDISIDIDREIEEKKEKIIKKIKTGKMLSLYEA